MRLRELFGLLFGANNYSCNPLQQPFDFLFLLHSLKRAGGDRHACHVIRAVAERYGADTILVVVTDLSGLESTDWLPMGVRCINLADMIPPMTARDKTALIQKLIAEGRPQRIFCVSRTMLLALADPEFHIARGASSRLIQFLGGFEAFFKAEILSCSRDVIRSALQRCDIITTDNERLRLALEGLFGTDVAGKAFTCFRPVDTSTDSYAWAVARKPGKKILWASRLHEDKRPDVLFGIVRAASDLQFEMYGEPFLAGLIDVPTLPNLARMGSYTDFARIPHDDTALFLYTSQSDGIPNVLLEAAAAGLPIVAPNIGAIAEFIDEHTGWLIPTCEDVHGYVQAMRRILADPQEARARAQRARLLLDERHSWAAFVRRLELAGIFPL